MAFAPTLTPYTDANPCPRVLVSFASTVRTNLVTAPSVETSTSGWGSTGAASASRVTTDFHSGAACWQVVTNNAASAEGFIYSSSLSGMANNVYSAGVWVKATAGATLFVLIRTTGASSLDQGRVNFTATGSWQFVTASGAVAQADATQYQVHVRTQTQQAATILVDDLIFEQAPTCLGFFSGASTSAPDTIYAWTGTANASTSTQTLGLSTGTQTINVYRTAEGRRFLVRGGVNLFAVGGASVMDYECPFGVAATYQAEQFDINGISLGFTNTTAITLNVTQTWIHQPLSPSLAVTGQIMMGTANDFMRPSPGQVVVPEGATVGRLIGGQRQGITQMPLSIKLGSSADSDEFAAMFGGYSSNFPAVLCIRTPPVIRMPRLLFAGCLQPHEVVSGVNRLLVWQMVIDEVAPPAPGLLLPTLRREDIDAAYATRSARAAAYATRLARDTDFTLAGLAG